MNTLNDKIENTNFINNRIDKSSKRSKMVSNDHIIVQNKYNDLQRQVQLINDVSATKLKMDKKELYKQLQEQNIHLIDIIKKNESGLTNINKKLDNTLHNMNIHETESLKHKKIYNKCKTKLPKKISNKCKLPKNTT